MSSSAKAFPPSDFSTCPRCARRYHPPHRDGCWPCRRVRATRPHLVEHKKSIDQLEHEAEAEAATYYFLESFHGDPDDP